MVESTPAKYKKGKKTIKECFDEYNFLLKPCMCLTETKLQLDEVSLTDIYHNKLVFIA